MMTNVGNCASRERFQISDEITEKNTKEMLKNCCSWRQLPGGWVFCRPSYLAFQAPPRGARGGHRAGGGGTKVEGFKPCYEDKV